MIQKATDVNELKKKHMLKLEVFPWLTVRGESHIDFRTQCVIITEEI